ncbi:hypothetical protein NDU88_008047 [Pleurodeles waltl]|uniref:Uncharacterized protein n=1 Tax=Pleurodeles waltl TaxID=8319 RepID=A0AAV7QML6_PLEWA|nr:hypothetical protein NDU88_008047 [Pleurodeles waltl]
MSILVVCDVEANSSKLQGEGSNGTKDLEAEVEDRGVEGEGAWHKDEPANGNRELETQKTSTTVTMARGGSLWESIQSKEETPVASCKEGEAISMGRGGLDLDAWAQGALRHCQARSQGVQLVNPGKRPSVWFVLTGEFPSMY